MRLPRSAVYRLRSLSRYSCSTVVCHFRCRSNRNRRYGHKRRAICPPRPAHYVNRGTARLPVRDKCSATIPCLHRESGNAWSPPPCRHPDPRDRFFPSPRQGRHSQCRQAPSRAPQAPQQAIREADSSVLIYCHWSGQDNAASLVRKHLSPRSIGRK